MKHVLIDVDGVLTDGFTDQCLQYLKEYLKDEDIDKNKIFCDLRDKFPTSWHGSKIEQLLIEEQGFVYGMKPYQEAIDFVFWLRKKEIPFKFVTIPWQNSLYWMNERKFWLEKHFGATKKDLIFAGDKSVIMGSVLIDDMVKNIIPWGESNLRGTPVLFKQPWNQLYVEQPNITKYGKTYTDNDSGVNFLHTNDWNEIKDLVLSLSSQSI